MPARRLHEKQPVATTSKVDEDDEEITCGICYDFPKQFGLLNACSHAFCLRCLRDWRNTSKKEVSLVCSNIIKTCPICRTESSFITPSSRFFADGNPKKAEMIAKYKASMAKMPCRYFVQSKADKRFCPYGYDCFYKHEGADGKPYKFPFGVNTMMSLFKERQANLVRQRNRGHLGRRSSSDALFDVDTYGVVGPRSRDPFSLAHVTNMFNPRNLADHDAALDHDSLRRLIWHDYALEEIEDHVYDVDDNDDEGSIGFEDQDGRYNTEQRDLWGSLYD